jgi:hypothetical protein
MSGTDPGSNGQNKYDVEIEPKTAPSKVGEWEELIFPVGERGAKGNYYKMGVQPDFADGRPQGTVVYIDDIRLTKTDQLLPTSIVNPSSENKMDVTVNKDIVTVTFNAEDANTATIDVYAMTGQSITGQVVNNISGDYAQASVLVPGSGIYLLKVKVGNRVYVTKFAK